MGFLSSTNVAWLNMPEYRNIGGVDVKSPIWLAPLAGVSTYTFRDFHRKMGAALVHTEMVSAIGLSYQNRKTDNLLGGEGEPGPMALQLFAPDADHLIKGARLAIAQRNFEALEINMACPMPKVTKKGSGAKLLEYPDEAKKMVKSLKTLGLPVWVKLRITEPRKHPLQTEEFCSAMLDAGADLLMLHGRTPAQRYEGKANKEAVRSMAGLFPGLLVASGDYYTTDDAVEYLDGGCVAVLAARGALRDVFLIPKTLHALGENIPENLINPTIAEQIGALVEMGKMGIRNEGESFTLVLVRRMLSGLFKGFYGASAIRQACTSCREWQTLEKTLIGFQEQFTQ